MSVSEGLRVEIDALRKEKHELEVEKPSSRSSCLYCRRQLGIMITMR